MRHPSRTLRRLAAFALIALAAITVFAGLGAGRALAEEGAQTSELDASVDVYRLYKADTGEHLLTKDVVEKTTLTQRYGWVYEGIGFRAPSTGKPVYRVYDPVGGEHLYTTDGNEVNTLVRQRHWRDEGVKFYSSEEPTAYPVYRLFDPNHGKSVGSHHWTLDRNEYDTLPAHGWRQESVKWYATGPKEDAPKPTTEYEAHGRLSVRGTSLVDMHGNAYQLRGMSTHGLSFNSDDQTIPFKDYVNEDAFRTLRDDWGANCVRLAMYTENYMGYCSGGNQEELKNVIRRGVNAARNLGMYVIVDWHILGDGNPWNHVNEARAFFSQMSAEFRDSGNVLYEICNEPNGVDWGTVKGYAEQVIPVIRANDPNAVVIVGTPTWSQDVDQAAANRLTGALAQNTMYALHFYANTHTQWLRDRMNAALDAGLPIFISEWGTCDASGNGGYNPWESQQWIDLANRRNVSWVNWSLCPKNETASAIQPWCRKLSSWEPWELTESGNWVRNAMRAAAGK